MKQVSLNFGAIKDTVYRYAPKQLMEGTKQTLLGTFVKTLKENHILRLQYLIYKNIEGGHCKKERLAERFIQQNLQLLEGVAFNKILDANREVRIKLLENAHVEGNAGMERLYEMIHTLIESRTRKGYSDIEKSEEAFDFVMEHLMREKPQDTEGKAEVADSPNMLSWTYVTKLAVDNFNERYAHLNETEKSLLKVLLSPEDKKHNYLEDLKKENTEMIDRLLREAHEDETKLVLESFKTKLSTLGRDNLDESIINCAELKEYLCEIGK